MKRQGDCDDEKIEVTGGWVKQACGSRRQAKDAGASSVRHCGTPAYPSYLIIPPSYWDEKKKKKKKREEKSRAKKKKKGKDGRTGGDRLTRLGPDHTAFVDGSLQNLAAC